MTNNQEKELVDSLKSIAISLEIIRVVILLLSSTLICGILLLVNYGDSIMEFLRLLNDLVVLSLQK